MRNFIQSGSVFRFNGDFSIWRIRLFEMYQITFVLLYFKQPTYIYKFGQKYFEKSFSMLKTPFY